MQKINSSDCFFSVAGSLVVEINMSDVTMCKRNQTD